MVLQVASVRFADDLGVNKGGVSLDSEQLEGRKNSCGKQSWAPQGTKAGEVWPPSLPCTSGCTFPLPVAARPLRSPPEPEDRAEGQSSSFPPGRRQQACQGTHSPQGWAGPPNPLSRDVVTVVETQKLPIRGLDRIQKPWASASRRLFQIRVCAQGEVGGSRPRTPSQLTGF